MKEKLSLDKLTVVKLSNTKNIFGGTMHNPSGITGNNQGPYKSHHTDIYVDDQTKPRFTTITPPEMRQSSKICAG